MTDQAEQQAAVRLILVHLVNEGREWYRSASARDVDFLEKRVSANFAMFDGNEIHTIGPKPAGAFPKKKMLLTKPSGKEKEAVAGFWLRWNFNCDPIEFRLFLGLWYKTRGERNFNGYRFETPEIGDEHDYYHCQPCRNFGDRELLPEAALVSEKFPTIPLNASNIVELTVCALMATLGRNKMNLFLKELFRVSEGSSNDFLWKAYLRCSKESFVDFAREGRQEVA